MVVYVCNYFYLNIEGRYKEREILKLVLVIREFVFKRSGSGGLGF